VFLGSIEQFIMSDPADAGARSTAALPEVRTNPWPALIAKIQADDAGGMEELYRVFSRGVRFFLCRQMKAEDLEDTLHDVFLSVTQAIRRGEVREPERLMGFVWTVVRRHLAGHIERSVRNRRHCADLHSTHDLSDVGPSPERTTLLLQHRTLARCVLNEVPARDREILIRFYLEEQKPDDICREMGLSETQFRLLKSRAKRVSESWANAASVEKCPAPPLLAPEPKDEAAETPDAPPCNSPASGIPPTPRWPPVSLHRMQNPGNWGK
jgi:RNA polymerase sigma-70 factor (ECF subfamily)